MLLNVYKSDETGFVKPLEHHDNKNVECATKQKDFRRIKLLKLYHLYTMGIYL